MSMYERYKKVNLPWLEKVPEHWEFGRIGRIFNLRKEKNNPIITQDVLSLSAKYGVSLYSEKKEKGGNKPKEDLRNYNVCYPGDILVNCMNIVAGSVGISNYLGAVSPVYYPLVNQNFEKFSTRYMEYVLRTYNFQRSLVGLGKGIQMSESEDGRLFTVRMRISWDMLKTQLLPIPPLTEQEQIAAYLDWKINEIDRLIRINNSKIAEINKYIISAHEQVLLKNNHELKSWIFKNNTSDFKDSELKITKIKNVLRKIEKSAKENSEIVICSNSGKSFLRGDKKIGLYSENINMYQNVDKGQLMIHGMDTWHGAICISDYSGRCTRVVHVCETTENKLYIYFYLRLLAFLDLYKPFSNGVRQNTSDFRSWEKFGQINIILPSHDEQNKVVDRLKKLIQESEMLIEKITIENDELFSLKTSLISDVVTGKIDVRNVVIPSYEKVGIDFSTDEEEIKE